MTFRGRERPLRRVNYSEGGIITLTARVAGEALVQAYGLRGERRLLLAVIFQAIKDVRGEGVRPSAFDVDEARWWLDSRQYALICEAIGVPFDVIDSVVERMS